MDLKYFRSALGKPAYEDDDVLLYQSDCVTLLEKFPADSIPLTVTSPPYNIGKEYESVREAGEYVAWIAEWANKLHRITTSHGALWLNVGYMPLPGRAKALPIPYLIWDAIPFFFIQEIVWNYAAGVAGKLFFSPRNEKCLWFVKNSNGYVFNLDSIRDPDVKYPHQKKNGKLKCNPLGKNPSDVWQIAKVTSGSGRASKERTPHPAQFPLDLVTRMILASSHKGDIVLDPFSGSGSTLEAAIRTGRKAIGVEIDARYIAITIERLKALRNDMQQRDAQKNFLDTSDKIFDGNQLQPS